MANELITTPAFEIFRAGTFTSSDGRVVTITVDDLEQIAQSYQPDVAAAPLVVGHPELDDPAYGWVKRLFVQGLALMAEARDVAVEFANMVNQKRFPNRSASIYLETTPGNPFPGKKYLKHVGFLGAVAPAIPGLKPVQFSADDKAVCFNFPIDNGVSTMEKDEMEQKQRELAAREAEIAAREAAVRAEQEQVARGAALNFAAKLADEGKLLPSEVNGIAELLIKLPNVEPLNFSANGTQVSQAPADFFKSFLTNLPNRINYEEKSANTALNSAPLQFSAPEGLQIDTSQSGLYQRAKAYQAQHPHVGWIEAVRAVGGY